MTGRGFLEQTGRDHGAPTAASPGGLRSAILVECAPMDKPLHQIRRIPKRGLEEVVIDVTRYLAASPGGGPP
jgi:hypothetical protein